jgi:hypothetical protein
MMKNLKIVKISRDAIKILRHLVGQLTDVMVVDVMSESDHEINISLRTKTNINRLRCHVVTEGQPRLIRAAALLLRHEMRLQQGQAAPVILAPYLSQQSQAICREHQVGFIDCQANAWLAGEHYLITSQVVGRPVVQRRDLRSLFKPKSAQVLKVMLRDPFKNWRVAPLAELAGVSLGLVSKVRQGLLDREWAQVSAKGMSLCAPDSLLDDWSKNYQSPEGKQSSYYTTLHGTALAEQLKAVMQQTPKDASICLASFSAAQWISPFVRNSNQYLYADACGLDFLIDKLRLSESPHGGIFVTVVEDPILFRDTFTPHRGIRCTSAVQTYLDLSIAGERAEEAAAYLRRNVLNAKKNSA